MVAQEFAVTLPDRLDRLALMATSPGGAFASYPVETVARNLGSRMLYDRLHFEDQQLADFLPRTVVNPDGEVRVVGRPRRDRGGRLHVVTQLDRLRHVGNSVAALVVEDSAATADSMRHLLEDAKSDTLSPPSAFSLRDASRPNRSRTSASSPAVSVPLRVYLSARARGRCGALMDSARGRDISQADHPTSWRTGRVTVYVIDLMTRSVSSHTVITCRSP